MLTEEWQATNEELGLEETIEREIARRTWSRVHSLRVEVQPGRVTVRGWTPSYYIKQLALAAVQENCGDRRPVIDIQVG